MDKELCYCCKHIISIYSEYSTEITVFHNTMGLSTEEWISFAPLLKIIGVLVMLPICNCLEMVLPSSISGVARRV